MAKGGGWHRRDRRLGERGLFAARLTNHLDGRTGEDIFQCLFVRGGELGHESGQLLVGAGVVKVVGALIALKSIVTVFYQDRTGRARPFGIRRAGRRRSGGKGAAIGGRRGASGGTTARN